MNDAKDLQSKLIIITLIDKATNNMAFTCRRLGAFVRL